uniref:Uncharacterized protein n=1 Tax=Pipistrellus kuhlii TaxID=59472 RepID=A0A7J7YWW1_PIPKU|nr:hypothetical protein mPipKuh1_009893 [Pipistrellus kuhlii]
MYLCQKKIKTSFFPYNKQVKIVNQQKLINRSILLIASYSPFSSDSKPCHYKVLKVEHFQKIIVYGYTYLTFLTYSLLLFLGRWSVHQIEGGSKGREDGKWLKLKILRNNTEVSSLCLFFGLFVFVWSVCFTSYISG